MIPSHLSLVTQLPEREAAVRAILQVEETTQKKNGSVYHPYPYARAFFRALTGSSKISGRAINRYVACTGTKRTKPCSPDMRRRLIP